MIMHAQRNLLNGGRANNCCYVAVMGMSGSGKTRFVANLLGLQKLSGDDSLRGGKAHCEALTADMLDIDASVL